MHKKPAAGTHIRLSIITNCGIVFAHVNIAYKVHQKSTIRAQEPIMLISRFRDDVLYRNWIFCPPVAQLVEREAYTFVVLGSSPSGRT